MSMQNSIRAVNGLTILAIAVMTFLVTVTETFAHGERMHQPSLRMRSIQWLDVTWERVDGKTGNNIKVGDQIIMKGKMMFPDAELWPATILKPEPSYLQPAGPASVFVKKEAYIGETPIPRSMNLKLGETYEFTMVVEARVPGLWHLHPALQITGTGPIVGPGFYYDVGGNWSDFVWADEAGRDDRIKIENMETFHMGAIKSWHVFWIVVALVLIGWWARRPMLMPRYRALREGHESLLITRSDVIFHIGLGVMVLVVVLGAQVVTWNKYPDVMPLQTGRTPVEPIELTSQDIKAKVRQAEFNVPNRSMIATVEITNSEDSPLWLTEFNAAGFRFATTGKGEPAVVRDAVADGLANYSPEYVLRGALEVTPNKPIMPGETVTLTFEAADAVWEVEGLSEVIHSPIRRFGGVMLFTTGEGEKRRAYIDFSVQVTYDIAS